MLGWLPNMSAEDAARREIERRQIKDDRTGVKDGKWNWQDSFGGFLGGYSQQDVEKIAQTQLDEQLKKKVDQLYTTTGTELSGLGLNTSYKGDVTGLTETEVNNLVQGDKSKLTAALNYLGIDGADAGDLKSDSTATGIVQAGTSLRASNKKADEKKVQDEVIRQEGRSDDRLALQLELNRLDRKDDREARRDQTALANRRLDIQEARGMRRDRQAAIQQMMAGLAQMGASIAI